MTAICIQCGKEFDGRADAKFCSGKCRVASHRGGLSVTRAVTKPVTDNPGVTDSRIAVTGERALPFDLKAFFMGACAVSGPNPQLDAFLASLDMAAFRARLHAFADSVGGRIDIAQLRQFLRDEIAIAEATL